jgi:ribosomal protein S18 acetylase RimI-like enzyme
MRYTEASTTKHFNDARGIFIEYQNYLGIDLCFQDFQTELDELPGKYSAPYGCIILVYNRDLCIGCVALRPILPGICEMKRLFVKPEHQGKNIGKELTRRIIKKAIQIGYAKMRLDTLDTMKTAIAIYKKTGFKEITAYYHNPLKNVKYFEYDLQ